MKNVRKQQVAMLDRHLLGMDLSLPSETKGKMLDMLSFLEHWNQAYNLVSKTSPLGMMSNHLIDSLSILPYIQGNRIVDVGAGAGFPGIPLALVHPDKMFTLVDSNGKKTRFLTQLCHELSISNVTIVNSRIEDYVPDECFDCVISRALSTIKVMLAKTAHLCCKGGQFLAMKGKFPKAELDEISDRFTIVGVHQLKVPSLEAERHLIIIEDS